MADLDVCPIAPYYLDLAWSHQETNRLERNRAIQNGIELIKRKVMDQMWFFGNRLSGGMNFELTLATDLGIPCIPKSPEMVKIFHEKGILFDHLLNKATIASERFMKVA